MSNSLLDAAPGRPLKNLPSSSKAHPTVFFKNATEIRVGIYQENKDALMKALITLRNQFTIKPSEESIGAQDPRLLLVQEWLNRQDAMGAQELFHIWGTTSHTIPAVIPPVLSILAALLNLLSTHYTYHTLGYAILKTLLLPQWSRKLNSCIGGHGSNNDTIISALKLWNATSNFASGKERTKIFQAFGWENKSLPKLLHARRKGKDPLIDDDPFNRPDIRTLYTLFLLSFLSPNVPSPLKTTFLSSHSDKIYTLIKGISTDHYLVVKKILEVLWAGVWSDPKIRKQAKLNLFGETTLNQLLKLYDRINPEGDEDNVPGDLVHHFLLAICTRPGTGVCFRDKGWYPRSSEGDEEDIEDETDLHRTGLYNKILAHFLKSLKANEDPRQQELVLRILEACPELVAGYWQASALTLEPRLSSKWISNIALMGNIVSLPIPMATFYLGIQPSLHNPSPPPLSTIVSNVIPPASTTKTFLTKGLQSTSPLVQHCTAQALCRCLMKLQCVTEVMEGIARELEEDKINGEGQWTRRTNDLPREIRKRVPEWQVIVAYSTSTSAKKGSVNAKMHSLLSESATRLMWLYHQCLPDIVREAKFDVGKMVIGAFGDHDVSKDDRDSDATMSSLSEESDEKEDPMNVAVRIHLLRLLKHSEQFVWSTKSGSSKHSYLHILLMAYTSIHQDPHGRHLHPELHSLLNQLLSTSIMFQDQPGEAELWLSSLPTTVRRVGGSESPDGARLTDEQLSVVNFLDDVVQRCLKTPYRYIEESLQITRTLSHASLEGVSPFSPLFMTVLEQLNAKISGDHLSPSDVLALATFLRKLIFNVSIGAGDLDFLCVVTDKIEQILILSFSTTVKTFPVILSGIEKEMRMMRSILAPVSFLQENVIPSDDIDGFLIDVEKLPIPGGYSERVLAAFELVDWVRLINCHLNSTQVLRVMTVIQHLYIPAIRELSFSLEPSSDLLWDGLNISASNKDEASILNHVDFCWLFLSTSHSRLHASTCKDALFHIYQQQRPYIAIFQKTSRLITREVSSEEVSEDLLQLVSSIIVNASQQEISLMKRWLFHQCPAFKMICLQANPKLSSGLGKFIVGLLSPSSSSDRDIVTEVSNHWYTHLIQCIQSGNDSDISPALTWTSFMRHSELDALLSLCHPRLACDNTTAIRGLVVYILNAFDHASEWDKLDERLNIFLSLRQYLPSSSVLETLISRELISAIPFCIDGYYPPFINTSFSTLLCKAGQRWAPKTRSIPGIYISTFLDQEIWTDATTQIISHLLLQTLSSRGEVGIWITSTKSLDRSVEQAATIIKWYLDISENIPTSDSHTWGSHVQRMYSAILDPLKSADIRKLCKDCLSSLWTALPSQMETFGTLFTAVLDRCPKDVLTLEVLQLGSHLSNLDSPSSRQFVEAVANHGIQWCTETIASLDTHRPILSSLERLIAVAPVLKGHFVDPFFTVLIQHQLSSSACLKLLSVVAKRSQLKPLIVNRHLQSVLQHAHFFKIMGNLSLRDDCTTLLHVLFNLHPINTCQVSHVQPLVPLYRGTTSLSDRTLLSIFQLFEENRKTSIASLLSHWSPSDSVCRTAADSVQNLDSVLVFRTCLQFPRWRRLADQVDTRDNAITYDPVFLLLLVAHAMAEAPPSTNVAWVEFFRTNVVGLLMRSLSCKDEDIRRLALSQLGLLWTYLQGCDMQEKPQVVHILNLLKDCMIISPSGVPQRLPSYTTLLLCHALRGVFFPSNFVYPSTARFLLQRPVLDTGDVPMLYNMLYSTSGSWKKERAWILQFLSDGMISSQDWTVFKRRHTWDLLATMFQSADTDAPLRRSILEILANLTTIRQAAMSLVLKSALLNWIEIQMIELQSEDVWAWAKIIENIIVTVDTSKVEQAISGEWRSIIVRCLLSLLQNASPESTALIGRVLLRLCLFPGPPMNGINTVLRQATRCLEHTETKVSEWAEGCSTNLLLPSFPHYSWCLYASVNNDNNLSMWGSAVESLWRCAMTTDNTDSQIMVHLSTRILVWRGLTNETITPAGEWARIQAVRNLASN